MEPVLLLKTVVVFTALLGVLVFFHELGHFGVARLVGMKVHEFAFGFGPILARLFKRNGTEFNVRAIPLGGFVRIAGMEPEDEAEENGFNSKSGWARAAVVLAGPVMSLVLGYIVFLLIGFGWGFVSKDKPPTNRIGYVTPRSVAAKAGIEVGDTVLSIDGKRINNGEELRKTTNGSRGKTLTFEIKRNGKTITIKAAPKMQEIEVEKGVKEKRWILGVVTEPQMERTGFVGSVKKGTEQTYNAVRMILTTIFSKEITKNVGGIVMIGYATSESVKAGPYNVLMLLGLLSVMLGIMNLIPWPVLDGGHLVFIAIEGIRRKKLKPETKYAIQLGGMAVLIGLAIFLVGFDIWRIAGDKLPGP